MVTLTKEELRVIRDLHHTGNLTGADVRRLLDFADEMLPVRDALVDAVTAKTRLMIEWRRVDPPAEKAVLDNASDKSNATYRTFWDLACKVAETDKPITGEQEDE